MTQRLRGDGRHASESSSGSKPSRAGGRSERRTAGPARDRRERSGGRPPRPEPPRPLGQGRRQHELRWLRHLRASPADRHATPPWGLRTLPGQRTRRDTRCRGGDGACRTSGGLRRATVPPWSLIGLTGGIGSGKSTVSALLAERGALVIDADAITRELQQPGTPVFAAMRERFGEAIIAADGIARPAGGRRHRVRRRRRRSRTSARSCTRPSAWRSPRRLEAAQGTDQVVILDVPLLVESGRDDMAALVVVDVDPEVAIERLVQPAGDAGGRRPSPDGEPGGPRRAAGSRRTTCSTTRAASKTSAPRSTSSGSALLALGADS